jgi:1-acyl-sn-glycerol-3-phosphate acyltransferase
VIRTFWTILVVLFVTPPLSLAAIVGALVRADDRLPDWLGRAWCRTILWASGVPVRAVGLEHVPRDRPVVIASNHASWFDVAALATLIPNRYRFVAKRELERVPLWGRAWRAAGHISIDRQDTQAAIRSLAIAGELIRSDNSAVVIFPEGTRSASDEMLPFKKGAFRLAMQLGVDIVPVGITGSRDVLPRNAWRVRRRPIIVRFGVPVAVAALGEDRLDELMQRVRSDIERLRHPVNGPESEEHAGYRERTRT